MNGGRHKRAKSQAVEKARAEAIARMFPLFDTNISDITRKAIHLLNDNWLNEGDDTHIFALRRRDMGTPALSYNKHETQERYPGRHLQLPPNDLPIEDIADTLINNVLDVLIDAQMPQLNDVSLEVQEHADQCARNAAKRATKANRPVWRTK